MSDFPAATFAGKRFAVVGLGRNGLPVARALVAMGAEVLAWDDAETSRAVADIAIGDPSRSEEKFDALILSPGIPHLLPRPHRLAAWASRQKIPILSDAELLFQAVRAAGSRAKFIGVTGTNGKSTTTALLAHIATLAKIPNAAGGNLGTPALALPLLGDDGVYILEMSSYMLERLATLRFDAAAMLNLSPDHLDRHGDMAGYAQAKRAVFDRQGAADLAVIGIDDRASAAIAEEPRAARVEKISGLGAAKTTPALPGTHNAQNIAAATALARHFGIDDATIEQGVRSFAGLPHRQQSVGNILGIDFINDSKATNADAAARALACYDRIVWIAGGIAKSGGIEPLEKYFPRIIHAELIGQDAAVLAATLTAHGVRHRIAGTLESAVPAAYRAARDSGEKIVLLSPACASFDQFSGFDQRGDRFAALVAALAQGEAA